MAGEEGGSELGVPSGSSRALAAQLHWGFTEKNVYFDSIPSWAHVSSRFTHGRSDAGPKRHLWQGRAGERCWKRERRDLISASKMARTKSSSIPSQLPSPTQAQHMPSPPAPHLHPDWRELTRREAISLRICGKRSLYFWVNFFPFSPQLPCSMLQTAPAGRVQAGVPQGGVFTPHLSAASRQDPKMH